MVGQTKVNELDYLFSLVVHQVFRLYVSVNDVHLVQCCNCLKDIFYQQLCLVLSDPFLVDESEHLFSFYQLGHKVHVVIVLKNFQQFN